mgnify:CR=1 FL=1
MKPILALISTLCLLSCSPEHKPFLTLAPLQTEIVFKNVSVIPMDRDTILENQVVVAKNGVITAIADTGKVSYNSDALVIDATGKYLMPGLAEMHAHVPPVDDPERISLMLKHANLIVTARDESGLLIGVSRALTDFSFCCYLSDLAVDVACQKQGIGKELIRRTHEAAKPAKLILLAAPAARGYYPHIGMTHHDSCWTLS